ncbi:DUF481 domain-containing protein [Erythrobacter sp. 3-20A1M]|uniref:DUF481 domain-containing protein n=1 Tax=Erythrobacter sp. 3-20A1M TaxID=2653850 RepID=UPI001BFC3B10|nr:DUF481 domain-containing protein [Erythrobacter sp. 3-20A1M]QWC55709.1 DUF481 domain-containing protein [Erythrobacter sp. 3-20A1M]
MKGFVLPVAAALVAFPSAPAHAEPTEDEAAPAAPAASLPDPVRAMIDAAIATGDEAKVKTVVELAKQTNPDNAEELAAIHKQFRDRKAEEKRLAKEQQEEAIRTAGVFERWTGEGQIGAFQSSGNSDNVGVSAGLKLTREGLDWTHQLRGTFDYQRSNGTTTREKYFAAYEPRYDVQDGFFVYGLAQYERDRFQGFNGRYALSAGAGYDLVNRDGLKISVKAGPAYRRTELRDGTADDRLAGLIGADANWRISDWLTFTQSSNAVAETGSNATVFFDSSNTTLNLVSGLKAKVSNRVSTQFTYQLQYDSNPAPGAVTTDTLSRFTLVYGF